MQEVITKTRVHSTPWINLEKVDLKLPSGKVIEHSYIDAVNDSVGAVVLKDNKLVLVRNFRFTSNGYSWEIPGGWMQDGECALEAIRRKVEDETGFSVEDVERLGSGKPWSGLSNKEHYYFLIKLGERLDFRNTDFVKEIGFFNFPKVDEMIKKGEIDDQSTITGIFLAKLHKNL